MPNDNLKNYLHLHFIVFIWGFTAVLGTLISLDALPLVWFRMLFAVGFIWVYLFIKKIPFRVSTKTLLKFLITGFIIALHWLTFFKAIKVSNISITLACLSTGAFFTSLIEPVLFGKKIVWYEVFFGLLVVCGLCIIFNVHGEYIEGMVYALICAFLSALFTVLNSKFVKTHNPTIISFYELAGGAVFFTLLLFLSNSFTPSFFHLSTNDLMYLMILSSICTAYAIIASTALMKYLSPYTVMLTINLEPIYGILLAVIIFKEKEKMSMEFYIGALIILVIVILNAIIKSQKKDVK
jgi:drug/metabolite transporter (DMT)-like permease